MQKFYFKAYVLFDRQNNIVLEDIVDEDNTEKIQNERDNLRKMTAEKTESIERQDMLILVSPVDQQLGRDSPYVAALFLDPSIGMEGDHLLFQLASLVLTQPQNFHKEPERKKKLEIEISRTLIEWNLGNLADLKNKDERMKKMDKPLIITGSIGFIVTLMMGIAMIKFV